MVNKKGPDFSGPVLFTMYARLIARTCLDQFFISIPGWQWRQ